MHPQRAIQSTACLLAIAIVTLVSSCSDDGGEADGGDAGGAQPSVCDTNNECVCAAGETCGVDCEPTGDCDVQCGAGASCDVDCAAVGACDVECSGAASCQVDCNGVSNCDVTCPEQGCTVQNCGEGCDVLCGLSTLPTMNGTTASCP